MPAKAATTHVLMDKTIVLYRRARSSKWQCRYKVDGKWLKATTKHDDFDQAKEAAHDLLIEAKIRKRSNLPVITRTFHHVAKLALERMDDETSSGYGKASYPDYKRIIERYLIPFFKSYSISNIDYAALERFDAWRVKEMGKAPTRSTLLSHNAALNRVFDEAVRRAFMSEAFRPSLKAKGKEWEKRPAFEAQEVRKMFECFETWIPKATNEKSKELRQLLRDYVDVLLDTGARPGKELLNLRWNQITYDMNPETEIVDKKNEENPEEPPDDPHEEYPMPVDPPPPNKMFKTDFNRHCFMTVNGKTGEREIVGNASTINALVRIIKRNYGIENAYLEPLKDIAIPSNGDYVFRTRNKMEPTSFQKMFEEFLRDHDLLIDPKSGKERVFYSLRHTYATLALIYDDIDIHLVRDQMGTSIAMLEKHYYHANLRKSANRLRNKESRRLIGRGISLTQPATRQTTSKANSNTLPKSTNPSLRQNGKPPSARRKR